MNTVSYILLGLSGAALALALYNFFNIHSFNKLRRTFFHSSAGADLENVLYGLHNELRDLYRQHSILEKTVSDISEHSQFAIQKVGMVRFNPFDDGGGNFSFSLALLNNHNTGVVITSMHGRQQNRIYTKRIEGGKSEMVLTEEELQAILLSDSKLKIVNPKQN